MIAETFTKEQKFDIANKIKDITFENVEEEMNKLIKIGKDAYMISERSKIGNNVVDYFTFLQRLETKGKYDVNFFEFLQNLEMFKEKKFIQTMFRYYDNVKNKNKTKNIYKTYKEIYNICISAINIMRPLNCMEIYTRYNSNKVLNFCAGWGGSMVAAVALKLDTFYGIEINYDLKIPYDNMISYLQNKANTKLNIWFENAVNFDYSIIDYDTVFVSPPYYFIEKYANNIIYKSKSEMDENFYKPIFIKTFKYLKKNGYYIINICKEVYEKILKKLLGEAHEIFPLKKSKRQNNYKELVYVWHKKNY